MGAEKGSAPFSKSIESDPIDLLTPLILTLLFFIQEMGGYLPSVYRVSFVLVLG